MTAPNTPASHDGTPRCGIPTKQGGKPCRQPAGFGTPNPGAGPCKFHGGTLPRVIGAVKRTGLETSAAEQVRALGSAQPVTDPLGKYSELVGELWALKEWFRDEMSRLDSWTSRDDKGTEDVRAMVSGYERSLDRVAKSLVDMLRLGLDAQALQQARTRPTREAAEQFHRVLVRVVADLELTPEQRATVPDVLSAAIRGEGLIT